MSLTKGKKRYIMKKIKAVLFLCLILSMLFSVTANASVTVPDVPYNSYTLDSHGNPVVNRDAFVPSAQLKGDTLGLEDLSNPQDIFYDSNTKLIYILDSGNSRIVVLNSNYSLNRIYKDIKVDGEITSFDGAKGISVNHKGQILISDTENARVLVLNKEGIVEKILYQPKHELVPEDFNFKPNDAIEDRKGFTYVLSEGSYYGALVYSEDGSFFQFYGANKVSQGALEAIEAIIDNLFTSDELRAKGVQNLPYTFTDLCIDNDDFLYSLTSVSQDGLGQVRKLSPNGENILSFRSGSKSSNADKFNFSDGQEYIDAQKNLRKNAFGDIVVDSDGFMYILDTTYGRVFIYDSACNLITIFGGGVGIGTQLGTFQQPVALAVTDSGEILVLDAAIGDVTVFAPTDYYSLIKQADKLYLKGDYISAMPLWEQVNSLDNNFLLAYSGIARGHLLQKNYKQAMDYAEIAGNTAVYAEAYKQIRGGFLKDNFGWIAPACVLLVVLILVVVIYTSKKQVVLIKNRKLRVMATTITHPLNSFDEVKTKQQGSVLIALIILAVYCALTILRTLAGGFMFIDYDIVSYNALYPVAGTVGMVLLWTVINWAVCTLLEGKGRIKEIVIVSCYSLLPQILYLLLFLVLSHVLIPSEAGFMTLISTICTLWTAVLIIFGMMTVHDYSFRKAVGTTILTLLSIVVVAFVILMLATLFKDFIDFIKTLYTELFFRYNS